MYLAIFTQFLRFLHIFFAHPINLKGLVVFYIFQRLNHIFKDDFTKFQDNSRTKGTFFFIKFQEFSRTKVKFKGFPSLCEPCVTTACALKTLSVHWDHCLWAETTAYALGQSVCGLAAFALGPLSVALRLLTVHWDHRLCTETAYYALRPLPVQPHSLLKSPIPFCKISLLYFFSHSFSRTGQHHYSNLVIQVIWVD